ncbi:hypothetical protein EW146_g4351 [Bondarzewia mesenterica]|uniref:Uncharacterized protein n=1 Tax=Bondarzewia mesenterica TaxID=1095465 RepID=A0A4S4LVD9_9AGAM|nr:hypothetical protein EW146_g4351 [Bondarzewia mesenterica]
MEDLKQVPNDWVLSLDDKYYRLDEEERAFFKVETGIDDDEELRRHIIAVQTEAFSIYQYPCIRIFEFARLKMARCLPIIICSSSERREMAPFSLTSDAAVHLAPASTYNYPIQNVIASDLRKGASSSTSTTKTKIISLIIPLGLWNLGHDLFRSTPESFPVPFIEGDVFDPSFLEAVPPFTKKSPCMIPLPPQHHHSSECNPRACIGFIHWGILSSVSRA